jgi:hypothetical protein
MSLLLLFAGDGGATPTTPTAMPDIVTLEARFSRTPSTEALFARVRPVQVER